jgi:cell division protein FtsL
MKRFGKEDVVEYEKKSFLDKSVQNLATNSIIEGYFPKENVVRQMAIKRVNKMLCVIISMLITVVIVSYYFVISCEMKLNDLSRQTVVLNNENSDLQNKLDSLKSFNNVDKTLQQNNMLQRAGQVIETDEVTVDSEFAPTKSSSKKVFNYALGF